MYKELSSLVMYADLDNESVLYKLGEIFRSIEEGRCDKAEIKRAFNAQIKHILKIATDYGFNDNLWHNYIAFFIIMNENPFSLTCEKSGAQDGSVNQIVLRDFAILKALFNYDFTAIDRDYGTLFSVLTDYRAVHKDEFMYNRNISEKVRILSRNLEKAESAEQFFDTVTSFYKSYGVGVYGMNRAFRIAEKSDGSIDLIPISNMDSVVLSDLVGYELQKKELIANTEAFVSGKKANNVLLYGDSGTGKSMSIKAIVNDYYDRGLRMIEIYKHQFKYLSPLIAKLKCRNYKFIIYMDDLSFEDFEIEYKFLKAVIEGGVETKPSNILIYATSNRRHLIKESWDDRHDEYISGHDKHHSDTVEEKLSLSSRFGVTINYPKPTQKEFFEIVKKLAERAGIVLSEEDLLREANIWELRHGGFSGRTAQQFIDYLLGM